MTGRMIALVTALCALAPVPAYPQSTVGQPPPPFRAGVEVVSVDVSVLDRQGRPITDLQPDDFVVTVAGRQRRVVSANFMTASAGSVAPVASDAAALPISSNDVTPFGRLIVFVVDQATMHHSELRHVAAAAGGFLSQLGPADRSALVLMPVGTGVPFTGDHESVSQGLQHASGLASIPIEPRNLGLDEVRAIAAGDYVALADVAARECPGGRSGLSAGGGVPADPGDGGGQQGGSTPGAGGAGNRSAGAVLSPFGATDSCSRQIQFEARSAWQQLHSTSLSSLAALRAILQRLEEYPGDKSVFLISGGWPLETREGMSELRPVADAAAAARATLFTLFAPAAEGSADRRTISTKPLADMTVRRWPLETLATLTGGDSYRVDVGADGIFARLGRELSGFYRLGVEQDATDRNAGPRPMRVALGRSGLTVRAPQRFTGTTYAERDVSARLEAALASPVPATGVGIRLASYVQADPDQLAHTRIVLVGEATRVQAGDVTFEVLLEDAHGKPIAGGKQSLGEASGVEPFSFSTSLSVDPGTYTVRAAVMDAVGTVGSVLHRVDARRVPIGPLTSSGIVLVRVPKQAGEDARLIMDGVRQDEKLALQLDLEGDADQVSAAGVVFEVLQSPSAPPLITTEAARMAGGGPALAQAVTDVRLLPPGQYIARARVTAHDGTVGEVDRPFIVIPAPGATTMAPGRTGPGEEHAAARTDVPRLSTGVRPFAVDQVLAPSVLGAFLDRMSARSDATAGAMRPAIEQAKASAGRDIDVPDALVSKAPEVASFLDGVSRLARAELAPAAEAFRASLRASADFYPAMVYLGACYAAGGKDQEAAGAWQTALIREGDVPAVHLLLIDALQRMEKYDAALAALERARRRWPDDPAFTRRFVVVGLVTGRSADALAALDDLEGDAEDEPALVLGLHALYEALVSSRPIETPEADRARMARYAERYRKLNGPSTALVDAWVAAVCDQP